MAPWLSLNAVVGNIYTGSLFLALIDFMRQLEPGLEGRNVSFFSYGSGCGASYSAGRVADNAAAWRERLDPRVQLDARRRLTVEEYEAITRQTEDAELNDGPELDPARWQLTGDLFFLGTKNHQRRYGSATAGRRLQRAG